MKCSIKAHPLRTDPASRKPGEEVSMAAPIGWPSYRGNATLVGQTPDGRITVYYDASLGYPALKNAKDLLLDAPRIMTANDAIFGHKSGNVNVIVFALGGATDGTGGADHMGCDFETGQNIEVCASYGQSPRCGALFEAELSENCMNGNLCGQSNGEALSRWCSMETNPGALNDFVSGPTWAQANYPNWVDYTENTDGAYESIGCGMCFISWMLSKGKMLSAIAQSMVQHGDSGTLADVYHDLFGGIESPWAAFLADVKALPNGVQDDSPFSNVVPPPVPPVPPVPPPPVPPPPVPPPPVPPPPSGTLKQQIDAIFAELKKKYANRPFILWALTMAQELIDAELPDDKRAEIKDHEILSQHLGDLFRAAYKSNNAPIPLLALHTTQELIGESTKH